MTEMNPVLAAKIIERTNAEFGTNKTRNNEKTLQELRCAECGGVAYMFLKSPWTLICNRKDKCDIHKNVKDLFPDIFHGIERTFPPTPDDPNRPGRIFLESRGIRQALIGLSFSYWKKVRNLNCGAVMFPVNKDAHGKMVYNGRLLNPPPGEGKTHNSGSTSGLFWSHPGRKYDPFKPVYITEGIINALSLIEAGFQAIAVLSSGQDVSKLNLDRFQNIVTAFDADRAGIVATKKWLSYFKGKRTISSILPNKGMDWNDHLYDFLGRGE